MNSIEIKNLTFRYKKKFVYDDFSLNISRGSWTTIVGPNGAGKSTLVKILAGLEKNHSNIKILNMDLCNKNLFNIRKEVGFVFDVPDNFFACETVEDELAFSLENLAVTPDVIKRKIKEISKLLDIEDLLGAYPLELSGGQKQKVAIGCALMLEPRILILDDAFIMIDVNEKKKILDTLKEYCIRKRVTVLYLTNSLDEFIYSDRLIILNQGKIVMDGLYKDIFEEENVLRKLGLKVPFSVELSKKLKLYNVLSTTEYDIKKVVDKL